MHLHIMCVFVFVPKCVFLSMSICVILLQAFATSCNSNDHHMSHSKNTFLLFALSIHLPTNHYSVLYTTYLKGTRKKKAKIIYIYIHTSFRIASNTRVIKTIAKGESKCLPTYIFLNNPHYALVPAFS